VGLGGGQRP